MESLKEKQLSFMNKNQAALKNIKKTAGPSGAPAKPIGRLVKDILDFLDPHKPKSAQEILNGTGIDVNSNSQLLNELKLNPFVTYQEPGLFSYKSKFVLKTREDLFELISKTVAGILLDDIKDSYKDVEEDVKTLIDTRKILRIVNIDTKQAVLFPNDPRFVMNISPEFQQLWTSVKIPDDIDLEKEMAKANLPMMKQEARKRPGPKSRKQNKQRKVKLTNTHLQDIDLTKDFTPPPKT